jgi:hypothetical protein
VFRHGGHQVIDVRKLRAWAEAHPDRDLRRALRRVVDERPEQPDAIEAGLAGDDGEPDDD